MAKPKSKSGKKKSTARKPSAPRARKVLAKAPAATAQAYPCLVHVLKGAEVIPVQVKDAAHHQLLNEQYGADHIQVQS